MLYQICLLNQKSNCNKYFISLNYIPCISAVNILKQNRGVSGNYEWIETEFEDSFKMPTYLVALVVSDYQCIKGISNTTLSGGVNISVCARPNAMDQLDLAYNSAIELLEFFEDYYNISYPLPKLGIVFMVVSFIDLI